VPDLGAARKLSASEIDGNFSRRFTRFSHFFRSVVNCSCHMSHPLQGSIQ